MRVDKEMRKRTVTKSAARTKLVKRVLRDAGFREARVSTQYGTNTYIDRLPDDIRQIDAMADVLRQGVPRVMRVEVNSSDVYVWISIVYCPDLEERA
jgi:hypothetical protein